MNEVDEEYQVFVDSRDTVQLVNNSQQTDDINDDDGNDEDDGDGIGVNDGNEENDEDAVVVVNDEEDEVGAEFDLESQDNKDAILPVNINT